jgi:hypothetical protein
MMRFLSMPVSTASAGPSLPALQQLRSQRGVLFRLLDTATRAVTLVNAVPGGSCVTHSLKFSS